MPRRVALLHELRSETDALYLPNQFLIVIDSDPPYISRELGKLVRESLQLHVLAHEHWHYLHNVSTIAGFKTFAITQHHVAAFSASRAGKAMSPEDARARMNIEYTLYGNPEPPDWEGLDVLDPIAVVRIEEEADATPYRGGSVLSNHVVVHLEGRARDGAAQPGAMLLGAIALYESIAAYVEGQVLAMKGQAPADDLATVPYRLAPLVFQHIVGEDLPYYTAALATLALLESQPGKAFLDLATRFGTERRTGLSDVDALERVIGETQGRREIVADVVLGQDLPDLERINAGRGLSDYAVKYYGSILRALLELRKRDPLFDLHILLGNADGLFLLFNNVDPCNVLQRYRGDDDDVGRDAIYGFDNTPANEDGITPSIAARSFHAQQHYVRAHLSESGAFVDAADAKDRCPYFETCKLDARIQTPDICRTTPWLAYPGAQDGCWYALGVAATHGIVKIRARPEP